MIEYQLTLSYSFRSKTDDRIYGMIFLLTIFRKLSIITRYVMSRFFLHEKDVLIEIQIILWHPPFLLRCGLQLGLGEESGAAMDTGICGGVTT